MEVATLIGILRELAPELSTTGFVNIAPGNKVMLLRLGVCIDPTKYTITSAVNKGVNILVSYHPWRGEAQAILLEKELGIIALHTAWDNAPNGVNLTFAKELGLTNLRLQGQVLIGNTDLVLRNLLERCQRAVDQSIIPYYGELCAPVRQVGIAAGPGFLPYNKKIWEICQEAGCDTIISSELSLVPLRFAAAHQMQLIDLGHSLMARPAMAQLAKTLKARLGLGQPVEFFTDCYGCNYYTNFNYCQLDDSEEFISLFTHR
ncbi:MAG TPA: Nif3-like dinuclear metal center hexameric protein [Bacillota bacterium]